MTDLSSIHEEDLVKYIVRFLSDGDTTGFSSYGYDLYIPNVMRRWMSENVSGLPNQPEYYFPQISPAFYSAAWELCRRGILRPGVQAYGAQSTDDGSGGNGYSITPFGEKWLAESENELFVPTEPGRFSQLLEPFSRLFGPGFQERANEAVRSYGGHNYLACCSMCGAAAESILLHLAIKKDGDEEKILKEYRASSGRKKLESLIVSGQKKTIQIDFDACFSLLKYWRDEASHGRQSGIAENEAYTSLALLLRTAQFASDNYRLLTS